MSKKFAEMLPQNFPMTFDLIESEVRGWLKSNWDSISTFLSEDGVWLLINRDLNGRVRLILPEAAREERFLSIWEDLALKLMERIGPHACSMNTKILFESDIEQACQGATRYSMDGFQKVWMVDRLATDADWSKIAEENDGIPRIVYFSIKGGVGRSTALAATAWHLAQAGKRVLVMDLDLESPGLSSALLPSERQPKYGITDWLVEDLVDNGDAVFDSMCSTSTLSHDGEIYVVPAHGAEHGEYIAKLGRVWMPKILANGKREAWSARLERLLKKLEAKILPDVILIDSRSGIDETASACITEIGANLVLMFALDGGQTWNGYRMLFEQWQRADVAEKIRERLKIVAAIVPELERVRYLEDLREGAYGIFVDTLYDEIAPAKPEAIGPVDSGDGKWRVGHLVEGWNFDEADEGAPHYPWAVSWHRSFAGLRSLQGRLAAIDAQEIQAIFGPLIAGVNDIADSRKSS